MIGSIVIIVAAALTEVGVTEPSPEFFMASADELWLDTEERSFINSYCKVVYSEAILL